MFEKIYSETNLSLAFKRVKAKKGGPGLRGQNIDRFGLHQEDHFRRLQRDLRYESYQPKPGEREWRPKTSGSGYRSIVKPSFWDKVVQTALYNVMGPLFEPGFHEHSYGFRPGRGTLDALGRTITMLDQGYIHVADADIKACFDSIPHEPLMKLISQKVKDQRVLNLIRLFLENGIMEGDEYWTPEEGTPQGAVMSPLLANICLNPLDHQVADAGFEMIRYADDFVILCKSEPEAKMALELVKEWMFLAGLTLHPTKTDIRNVHQEGLSFLGYRFKGTLRSPRPENVTQLKDKIRESVQESGTTNLNDVIPRINEIISGWYQHFQLCNNPEPFQDIDYWVWQCLTVAQEEITRRNKPHKLKPLQRAPYSLARAFQVRQGQQ